MRPKEILDFTKDYVRDNSSPFYDDIDAKYSDIMARPSVYKVDEYRGKENTFVEVLLGNGDHNYGEENAPTPDLITLYDVSVLYTHTSQDIDEIRNSIYYFCEALTDLVLSDDTFGGRYIWVQLGQFGELPLIRAENRYKQSYVVGLRIRAVD